MEVLKQRPDRHRFYSLYLINVLCTFIFTIFFIKKGAIRIYNAYVTRIKNLHKHPNADRLQIGECFGNSVIVSMDYTDNELGVYFPTDGQLSKDFAEANNLLRKKDESGKNIGGYMDPDKRNVTTIKLRGEVSDGLFLPVRCLLPFADSETVAKLQPGDIVTTFNGHEICKKYIPRRPERIPRAPGKKKVKTSNEPVAPLFKEHEDTAQLDYNLSEFKPGDHVEITLKEHGTSQRTGRLPVLKGYKRTLIDRIRRRPGKPIYEWDYISGTRRTTLNDFEDGGYYGSNAFRKPHHDAFVGKLEKGEEVYYEVVGFTTDGTPIMPPGQNKKVGDDFIKQYGETTTFSYGCTPHPEETTCAYDPDMMNPEQPIPQSDLYVYRMTMTNEDGFTVEYPPDFMRYRCEQMGVKTVPVFWHGYIDENEPDPGAFIEKKAKEFYDGTDPLGKTHIREGVVCRILNRAKFKAYKKKNDSFKILEGIIKESAKAPDMEEGQEETDA